MKIKKIILLIIILTVGTLPLIYKTVESHSLGASIEKEVDGYLVDIGHSADPIVANDQVRFEFDLLEDGDLINYSDVWVRIADGQKTIFAGNLGRPPLGPIGMTITIPESGDYVLSTRYVDSNGDEIVQSTSTLPVAENPNQSGSGNSLINLISIGFIGILAGYGSAWFFRRKNKYLNKNE